jgi:hypothetical protein
MASLLSALGIDALSVEQRWQLLRELSDSLGAETRPAAGRSLTEEEFQRRLLELGLMSQVPTGEGSEDDAEDVPVPIPGEPLSETVIRERR